MQMVTEVVAPGDQISLELSSVASACLFSLVVALGDTGQMLAALTAMLTAPVELSEIAVQVRAPVISDAESASIANFVSYTSESEIYPSLSFYHNCRKKPFSSYCIRNC